MPPSEKTANEIMFQQLAESLDNTSKLTQALLNEIRASEADFADVKGEMKVMRENVKSLSIIVKEGNGAASLLTKIALAEKKLNAFDKWVESHIELSDKNKEHLDNLVDQLEEFERRVRGIEQAIKVHRNMADKKDKEELAKFEADAIKDSSARRNNIVVRVFIGLALALGLAALLK